ncbi:MAG: hypothetical protein AAGC49_09230, partial [Brevundimonas sp.]
GDAVTFQSLWSDDVRCTPHQFDPTSILGAPLAINETGDGFTLTSGNGEHTVSLRSSGIAADKAALELEDEALAAERAAVAADPDSLARVVAAKRAARAAHDAEAKAAATASARSDDPNPHHWPTGIFEDPEGPAPGMVFLGSNRWVGDAGDGVVAVYAGVSGADATTGRLMIMDPADSAPAIVDLAGSGKLHVESADGSRLTIKDAHGAIHVFDVATVAWRN